MGNQWPAGGAYGAFAELLGAPRLAERRPAFRRICQCVRILCLVGPANNKPSWFKRDNNNFAPRIAFAYNPQGDSALRAKILGKGGVFRGGASVAYDRFGSDMIVQFDNQNSFGLTENDILGSFNFTTAPRYNGTLPALPSASPHTFPFHAAQRGFGRLHIFGHSVGSEDPLRLRDQRFDRPTSEGRFDA